MADRLVFRFDGDYGVLHCGACAYCGYAPMALIRAGVIVAREQHECPVVDRVVQQMQGDGLVAP
jgi:hypothetical protein